MLITENRICWILSLKISHAGLKEPKFLKLTFRGNLTRTLVLAALTTNTDWLRNVVLEIQRFN